MTETDWKRVSHILPQSQFGDKSKICRTVILALDDFCAFNNCYGQVTCGTQGQHAEKSYHYATEEKLGCALDVMFPGIHRRDLPDAFINLLRFDFRGLGLYSEWRLGKDQPPIGGVHIDTRPVTRRALWIKGHAGYEELSIKKMQEYFT